MHQVVAIFFQGVQTTACKLSELGASIAVMFFLVPICQTLYRVFVCPFWATRADDSYWCCVQEAHRAKASGRVGRRLLCKVRRLCVAVRNWAPTAQDFSERKMWPVWWTRRRTSPGLWRPDKRREILAASLPSCSAPQSSLSAWHGRPDGERLASKSRQKRHVASKRPKTTYQVHSFT